MIKLDERRTFAGYLDGEDDIVPGLRLAEGAVFALPTT